MAKKQNPVERFNRYTKRKSSCWEWVGYINSTGRGAMWLDGKWTKAHRYSWELFNGKIPKGMLVCHKCDNGKCVNPEHLFLGTHKDNTQDMIKKGRMVGNRKLNSVIVENIRNDYANNQNTYKSLSKKYGVHLATVGRIVTKKIKYA